MSGVPEDIQRRSGNPLDGFKVSMTIATYFGLFLSLPFAAYQVYAFIRPALQSREDNTALLYLFGGFILILGAITFTHFSLPHLIGALLSFLPEIGVIQADILDYVSTILTIYLGFAIVFQIPLLVFLSILQGFVAPEVYSQNRRWVVVILLILCAIFSPPDFQSQLLIFFPLYTLFELALLLGRLLRKKDV
jgi:sec-independent protein translocase protein TatC